MRTFSSTDESSAPADLGIDRPSTPRFGSFGRAALSVAAVIVAAFIAFAAVEVTSDGLPRPFDLGQGATSTPGDGSVVVVDQVAVTTRGADPGGPAPQEGIVAGDTNPAASALPSEPLPTPGATGAPAPDDVPLTPPASPTVPGVTTTLPLPLPPLPAPGDELLPGVATPGVDVQLPGLPPITLPPVTTSPVTIPDLGLG